MHSPDLYGPAKEDGGETVGQSQQDETDEEGESGEQQDCPPPG